jgi:hypothetical protein
MFANRSAAASIAGLCVFVLGSLAGKYWARSLLSDPQRVSKTAQSSLKAIKAVDSYSPVIIGVAITLGLLATGLLLLRGRATPLAPPPADQPGTGTPIESPAPADAVVTPNPLRHLIGPILAVAAVGVAVALGVSALSGILNR